MVENAAVGSWIEIGYSAPGERSASNSFKSKEFHYVETASGHWASGNENKLDACAAESGWTATHWTLEATAGTGASSKGQMSLTQGGTTECVALTPAFKNLSRSMQ